MFEENGTLTAGNSSPVTDGAAAVLLMSEERAKTEGRDPLAFIRAMEYGAIDPEEGLLMAAAVVVPRLLERTSVKLGAIDLIEIHEAFAAQVLRVRILNNHPDRAYVYVVDSDRLYLLGTWSFFSSSLIQSCLNLQDALVLTTTGCVGTKNVSRDIKPRIARRTVGLWRWITLVMRPFASVTKRGPSRISPHRS